MMTSNSTTSNSLSRTKRPTLIASIIVFLVSFGSFSVANEASAHDSNGYVWIGNQRIYNHDYRSQSATAANADWPIHIVFWNAAQVYRVKSIATDYFKYNCNVFNLCNQNIPIDRTQRSAAPSPDSLSNFVWDTDGGRKQFRCGYTGGSSGQWALHYRAYDDRNLGGFWNPYWGHWVPVTTHYDYDDPDLPGSSCDNKQHGYDEEAEWNAYFEFLNKCPVGLYGGRCSGIQNYEHMHNGNRAPNGSVGVRIIGGVGQFQRSVHGPGMMPGLSPDPDRWRTQDAINTVVVARSRRDRPWAAREP